MWSELLKKLKNRKVGEKALVLRHRSDLHLTRKMFHTTGGISFLFGFLVLGYPREVMAAIIGIVLAIVMSIEYARMRWEWVNGLTLSVFGSVLRDTEVKQLSGIPFYMASCLFSFLIFPRHVTVLSILYLAFGDPSSSFFGVLWGRNRLFPNKSLQGTLGGFFVCAAATLFYLHYIGVEYDKLAVMVLIGGFAGAVAELLPLNIDDNFAIPVVSGAIMYLAFYLAELPLT